MLPIPADLAATAVSLLAAQLPESAIGASAGLGEWLDASLRSPASREALADLTAHPDDQDTQAALRWALKKELGDDPSLQAQLAARLDALVQSTPSVASQTTEISGSGNVVVQISGIANRAHVGAAAHLTLTRYLGRRASPAQAEPLGDAAGLLSPYALSLPLIGRERERRDLWAWLRSPRPVSVRVFTAPAGTGKTRLALELCDETARQGWDAGFVTDPELARFTAARNLSTWGWIRPTLVVVDYAATRARLLHDWLIELADHRRDEGPPLRLLLLERHAEPSGGWWREAFGHGGGNADAVRRLLDPPAGPYRLQPLAAPEDRRAVLVATLERVGSQVRPPAPAASPQFDRRLAEISWGGEPLFLMMAGLAAARSGFGELLALSATELGFHIARRELGRVRAIAASRNLPEALLAHLVAYVTLCQGLARPEVLAAIEEESQALAYRSAADPPQLYQALATAVPGEQGAIAPVLPDVIGEAVILEALGDGAPDAALAAISRAATRVRERVTATLIRVAQDYGVARGQALAWFETVAAPPGASLQALEAVLSQLPDQTVALRQQAASIAQRAVSLARERGPRRRLSRLLSVMSRRLSALGKREDAMAAADEGLGLRREVFNRELATSVHSLSLRLHELGRFEEALAASEQAVAILRQLLAPNPEALQSSLAAALKNLATCLSDLGKLEGAMEAGEEAVRIYRQLTVTDPESFQPTLALALSSLSSRLRDLGRHEDAQAAIEESVATLRQLAAVRPDAFRSTLARSLNTLSNSLSDLGRGDAALAASEEAVAIGRQLAARHPEAFLSSLATSLHNLALRLSDLGRREEALPPVREAIAIRRQLAAERPEVFRRSVARSLNNLSLFLGDLGMYEAALAPIEEAIAITRSLARPDVAQPALALMLSGLSIRLNNLGRHAEALASAEEAVALCRQLEARHATAFLPNLVIALDTVSRSLSQLGRHEPALAATTEAIALRRRLVAAHPEAFRRHLPAALEHLAGTLMAAGRQEEALAAKKEAANLRHEVGLPPAEPLGRFRSGLLVDERRHRTLALDEPE